LKSVLQWGKPMCNPCVIMVQHLAFIGFDTGKPKVYNVYTEIICINNLYDFFRQSNTLMFEDVLQDLTNYITKARDLARRDYPIVFNFCISPNNVPIDTKVFKAEYDTVATTSLFGPSSVCYHSNPKIGITDICDTKTAFVTNCTLPFELSDACYALVKLLKTTKITPNDFLIQPSEYKCEEYPYNIDNMVYTKDINVALVILFLTLVNNVKYRDNHCLYINTSEGKCNIADYVLMNVATDIPELTSFAPLFYIFGIQVYKFAKA